jgi:hypothetical protein
MKAKLIPIINLGIDIIVINSEIAKPNENKNELNTHE